MDLANPDQQHRSRPQGGGQPDHHAILALDHGQTNPRAHAFGGAAHEAVLLAFLSDESLHHAQAAQHFLDDSQSGLFEGLHLTRPAAKSASIVSPHHEKGGRNHYRHQRQLPGDSDRDVEHRRHRETRADEGNDGVDRNRLDGRRVVLQAVDGLRGTPSVVKQERQSLDVAENLAPQLQEEPFPRVRPQKRNGQPLQLARNGHDHQQSDRKKKRRGVGRRGGGKHA